MRAWSFCEKKKKKRNKGGFVKVGVVDGLNHKVFMD